MSVYKVPQDVEAEDKLLGPFSFKQFIFLIIAVMGIGMAYGLSKILLPLAIIPLPAILLFGALALPLKKDQPMEVYLGAVISFILKPKVRLWKPDGIESLVDIIIPPVTDENLNKGFDQQEVERRMSYLAQVVDSQGWAVRGVNNPESPLRQELYNEAQTVNDLLDENNARSQQIGSLMSQSDMRRRQEMVYRMHNPTPAQPAIIQPTAQPQASQPTPVIQPILSTPQQSVPEPLVAPAPQIINPVTTVQVANEDEPVLTIDPYPNSMKQAVLSPVSDDSPAIAPSTPTSVPEPVDNNFVPVEPTKQEIDSSIGTISPAIMNLANNKDLSIEVIQREANRIDKRARELEEEVVISLR